MRVSNPNERAHNSAHKYQRFPEKQRHEDSVIRPICKVFLKPLIFISMFFISLRTVMFLCVMWLFWEIKVFSNSEGRLKMQNCGHTIKKPNLAQNSYPNICSEDLLTTSHS